MLHSSKFVKEFIGILIPVLVMIVLHFVTNIIDGFFIGNFVGEIALAGVQFITPVMHIVFAISLMIASGCATMIGIAIGAKNSHEANQSFAHGWICTLALSVLLFILGSWGVDLILKLLNTTPLLWDYSKDYIEIRLTYSGFFAGLVLLESALRNDGQAKAASICVAIGALTNFILTYFFVLNWGVSGAATATIASESFVVVMLVFLILKKKGLLRFVKPILQWKKACNLLYNGSSDAMSGIANSIVIYAFNLILLKSFQEKGVAAFAVINYLSLTFLMIHVSVAITMQTFVSRSYGEKDYKQVLHSFYFSLKLVGITSICIYGFIAWQGKTLSSFFVSDTEMITMSYQGFLIYGVGFASAAFNQLSIVFFTSLRLPLPSLAVALCEDLVFILIALVTLPYVLGNLGVWLSFPVADFITLFISIPIFLKYRKQLLKPITSSS